MGWRIMYLLGNRSLPTKIHKHGIVIDYGLKKGWFAEGNHSGKNIVQNISGKLSKLRGWDITECWKLQELNISAKSLFEQHKRNMKHLYKLVAKLTGSTSVNPLPEMDSDEWLGEDFADYFLNKIVKIRDDLDQYGQFW